MKKLIGIIILVIVIIVILLFIAWGSKTWIAASYLSRALGVPVSIKSLEISKDHASITKFHVGNPKLSKTKTAFQADHIGIDSTWKDIRGNPLTIEGITAQNIFIGLEYYNSSGSENNWAVIMGSGHKDKKESDRGWLIKRLTLLNLTVPMTKSDGSVTRYPTLSKLEFYNLSDKTGFPIDEIEKAIFNTILRSTFQKLGIEILRSLQPQMWIPDVVPFPFGGSGSHLNEPAVPSEEESIQ